MNRIRKEDIINEDNKIYNFGQMKKIMNSGIEDCVFKIIREKEKSVYITGTGFFCNIRSKNIKVLITNNHVLDQIFLEKEKKLKYIIDTENKKNEKEINLEIDRYKYTDVDLDFTIIEILPEDNINNYLEIDEYINSKEYKKEDIFSVQYPKGKELKISMGEYLYKDDIYFAYSIGTESGTSGSPIILYDNMKIIGMHKGTNGNSKNKINIGISFNYIINKINFIKCIYNINDTQEIINLINNKTYKDIFDDKYEINEEIENKMKININGKISPIIFKTKFNKIGNHTIYFISNENKKFKLSVL
jgi:V8-like Glu-specific endopeptidase